MNISDNARSALRRGGCVALGLLTALALTTSSVPAQDTGALILARCVDCHEMDKTCAVQSDDPQWWNGAVLRMVEYKSELLTADEASAVSAFLADPQKRATVCTSK